MLDAADVSTAAKRISSFIRQTPLMRVDQTRHSISDGLQLTLKLELLQVTGSFKARGAMNRLLSMEKRDLARGIVTASGGNHGLAVAWASDRFGAPATVFLPDNAAPEKIEKLRQWGAQVKIAGTAWHEANAAALAYQASTGAQYVHPFADAMVIAGQGTLGLEILEQLPNVTTVLVAIGGGGLIGGLSLAIRARAPHVRIIGVEAKGSPVIAHSLANGYNTALDAVTTRVATMSCAKTSDLNFDLIRDNVDDVVLVSDEEMEEAARWLWFEMGLAADLSGAATIAALMHKKVTFSPAERVCAIICGAGTDGIARP